LREGAKIKLFDTVLKARPDNVEEVKELTGGMGCEKSVECSANARLTIVQATRKWGKIVLIGEGGLMSSEFAPSRDMIHDQKTMYGSWVTNLWRMEELVERLVRWNIHPDELIIHQFPLEKVAEAYPLMAGGKCGKFAVCFDEELN